MNRDDLYQSFCGVDDEILERSEAAGPARRRPAWVRWAALAACLALVLALPGLLDRAPGTTEDQAPLTDEAAAGQATSDTYAGLPELLVYLSGHDSHGGDKLEAGGFGAAAGQGGAGLVENTGAAVAGDGGYVCHMGEEAVRISLADGETFTPAASVDGPADGIFLHGDTLFVVSQFASGGDELQPEWSVRIGAWDLTDPRRPALLDEYIQLGQLTACWMDGAALCVVTGDGVCACGWSRLDGTEGYVPRLSHNGEDVAWDEGEISILGAPTRLQYAAVTVIDGDTRAVAGKKALYGDFLQLFYGPGYLAATVAAETATSRENPVLYTFDGRLQYTGKVSAAQLLGLPEQNPLEDYSPRDGAYLEIAAVERADGVYRMLGTCTVLQGEAAETSFVAIAADPATGEAGTALLPAADDPYAFYTEVRWEEGRAIACVAVARDGGARRETRFLFAGFDGLTATLTGTELTGAYLDGRVGVSYGNPMGAFETLIPMGDGIYLRYSHPDQGPGGFDVYDFSHSAAPSLLYRAGESLGGRDAFDYVWHVYDGRTVGILKVLTGEEDPFRDVGLAWCVCRLDDAGEPALLRELPLEGTVSTYFGADAIGFAVFPVGDTLCYVTRAMDAPAALE